MRLLLFSTLTVVLIAGCNQDDVQWFYEQARESQASEPVQQSPAVIEIEDRERVQLRHAVTVLELAATDYRRHFGSPPQSIQQLRAAGLVFEDPISAGGIRLPYSHRASYEALVGRQIAVTFEDECFFVRSFLTHSDDRGPVAEEHGCLESGNDMFSIFDPPQSLDERRRMAFFRYVMGTLANYLAAYGDLPADWWTVVAGLGGIGIGFSVDPADAEAYPYLQTQIDLAREEPVGNRSAYVVRVTQPVEDVRAASIAFFFRYVVTGREVDGPEFLTGNVMMRAAKLEYTPYLHATLRPHEDGDLPPVE